MFCAGCGTQIQSGLNYCSRCGRRVVDDSKAARSPLAVAGNIAGVGFVAYIFVLLVLSKSGVAPDVFKLITVLYFAALFGLCFMFLRQGPQAPRSRIEDPNPSDARAEHAYLRPVTTAQLEDARDFGIPSVTDATTRTLDEVPIADRKS